MGLLSCIRKALSGERPARSSAMPSLIGREGSPLTSEKVFQDKINSEGYKEFEEWWRESSKRLDQFFHEALGLDPAENLSNLQNPKATRMGSANRFIGEEGYEWRNKQLAAVCIASATHELGSFVQELKWAGTPFFFKASARSKFDESVQAQGGKVSSEELTVFTVTYACYVMWGLKRGMETLLTPEAVEPVIVAMRMRFATDPWYRADVFEKIWEKMQFTMRNALSPSSGMDIMPTFEMMMAAELAGYRLNLHARLGASFAIAASLALANLIHIGRFAAKDYLDLNAGGAGPQPHPFTGVPI